MAVGRSGGHFRIESMTVTLSVESDSWVVTSRKSDQLLNHEQGHFDITGLLWRDLATDILNIRARSTTALRNEINRLMSRARPLFRQMTDDYDTETNHSQNRDAQKEWDDRIRDAIEKGTRFAPRGAR
jgi:predicted secreted Zn-dependent protease